MQHSMKKPVFLFDAQCGLCTYWVGYWKQATRGRVVFRSIEDARSEYPDISNEAFERSSQFVQEEHVYEGAEGVVRMLTFARGKQWLLFVYRFVPFMSALMEWGYKRTSSCKDCSASLSKLLWGNTPAPACLEWVWMYRILFTLHFVSVFSERTATYPTSLLFWMELFFSLFLFAPKNARRSALGFILLLEFAQYMVGSSADYLILLFASLLLVFEHRN